MLNTLVDVRAPARPASQAGASRPWLGVAVQFLAGAFETLSRSEATRKDSRRRRYTALLAPTH